MSQTRTTVAAPVLSITPLARTKKVSHTPSVEQKSEILTLYPVYPQSTFKKLLKVIFLLRARFHELRRPRLLHTTTFLPTTSSPISSPTRPQHKSAVPLFFHHSPSTTMSTPPLPQPSPLPHQPHTISSLRLDHKLWYKLHVFIHDLRFFRSNTTTSRFRLDWVVDTYYIGWPYFSDTEVQQVLHTVVDAKSGKTLQQTLDDFFSKKLEKRLDGQMKETGDYRVCAAHDLAPVVEKVFGVDSTDLKKNKGFVKLVEQGGLEALNKGGVWKGMGKKVGRKMRNYGNGKLTFGGLARGRRKYEHPRVPNWM